MDDAAIGWGGLALSLILVGVAVGLSVWQGLRLERDMLWAAGRALVQLLAVGYVLLFIVDDDTPGGLGLGVGRRHGGGVAPLTARRRAPEVPGIAWLTLAATSGVGGAQPVRRVRPGRLPAWWGGRSCPSPG